MEDFPAAMARIQDERTSAAKINLICMLGSYNSAAGSVHRLGLFAQDCGTSFPQVVKPLPRCATYIIPKDRWFETESITAWRHLWSPFCSVGSLYRPWRSFLCCLGRSSC